MKSNLRHLRVFASVVQTRSLTRAAAHCGVSQPAVTQAIAKLEKICGHDLLIRSGQGIFATGAGTVLANRIARALVMLDSALMDVAPRLTLTATASQLQALIAACGADSFAEAARRMGLAQPTVHRAISQLEQEAGRALFDRTAQGLIASKPARQMAQAAALAFAEMDQAETELAELSGREVGRITIGAMPLSRSYLLARTIARFRADRASMPIRALDGPYDDLMTGLRRGEIDFLIGALRETLPHDDVIQEPLFEDGLQFVARSQHPIFARENPNLSQVLAFPAVVSAIGTPARRCFDDLCAQTTPPPNIVETGSMILMRELLRLTDHIGFVSQRQIAAEVGLGALKMVPILVQGGRRSIGVTLRKNWMPTRAQSAFLADLRHVAQHGIAP